MEHISQSDALAVCSAMPNCGGISFTRNEPFGFGHTYIANPHSGDVVHFYDSNSTGTASFEGQATYHEGWISYCKWNYS